VPDDTLARSQPSRVVRVPSGTTPGPSTCWFDDSGFWLVLPLRSRSKPDTLMFAVSETGTDFVPVLHLHAPDMVTATGRGTLSFGRAALWLDHGFYRCVVSCIESISGDTDVWDVYELLPAADPTRLSFVGARSLTTGEEWSELREQASGGFSDWWVSFDPTREQWVGRFQARLAGFGSEQTYAAFPRGGGDGFIPSREPLLAATGCGDRLARLTASLVLDDPDGSGQATLALADIASFGEPADAQQSVYLRKPGSDELEGWSLGEDRPPLVGTGPISESYGWLLAAYSGERVLYGRTREIPGRAPELIIDVHYTKAVMRITA
jgi:hypothetical protein